MLAAGVRLDERVPGSGRPPRRARAGQRLGLAVVRDIASLYASGIALGRSPLGGLHAELRLPAVDP